MILAQFEHSGPLPDARWFQAVENIHPGATEMLLNDYREQRDHAREMEREALELDERNLTGFIAYQTERLRIAGGLAALLVVAGIVFAAVGLPLVGLGILVAEIAGLVAAFFGGRLMRRGAQENLDTASGETQGTAQE